MSRIRSDYSGWVTPANPPARNWLYLNTEIRWFSYGMSFGRGDLCSELYIKVPGDAAAGQRIMSYLCARSADLEGTYGKRLRYQDASQMERSDEACRVADYRLGGIGDVGDHKAYLDWFLDSQSRLRSAVDSVGGLLALQEPAYLS
jgi:hypothetical protein